MPFFYRFVCVSYILIIQEFITFTNFQQGSVILNLYCRLSYPLVMIIYKLISRLHYDTVKKVGALFNFMFVFYAFICPVYYLEAADCAATK